jgi:hypothetical protein
MNEEVSVTLNTSSSLLLSTRRWSSLYVNKASALLVQDWNILVNYHLDLSGHHCCPVIRLHLPLKQMAAIPNSQSYTCILVMDGNLPCDEVKAACCCYHGNATLGTSWMASADVYSPIQEDNEESDEECVTDSTSIANKWRIGRTASTCTLSKTQVTSNDDSLVTLWLCILIGSLWYQGTASQRRKHGTII